ncbi:hypothetical protein ABT304_08965 [Nocardioides sp. NPDC000445]|uniref:hypothetical protein n=1 Tax=Nocardioides sp. NPDC000445 TaxID=3154257 RepID=UPI003331FF0A
MSEIVTFGQYKGQPIEVLLADRNYCEWLLSRHRFAERESVLYQTIINYGGPPQDSPEHNQMQAKFLDKDYCLALAKLLDKENDYLTPTASNVEWEWLERWRAEFPDLIQETHEPAGAAGIKFEDGGWDVTFNTYLPQVSVTMLDVPPCECGPCVHECVEPSRCRGDDAVSAAPPTWDLAAPAWGDMEEKGTEAEPPQTTTCAHEPCKRRDPGMIGRAHHTDCRWHGDDFYRSANWRPAKAPHRPMEWWQTGGIHTYRTEKTPWFAVELKPDLGDDFPSILRQVKRHKCDTFGTSRDIRRVVVARRADFAHVTWAQVKEMFAAEDILVVREHEIDSHQPSLPEANTIALPGSESTAEGTTTRPRLAKVTRTSATIVNDTGAEIVLSPEMAQDLAADLLHWAGPIKK